MPEQPVYNPNNIIRKESVGSNIPTYNPNNIVKKEVVDTREFTRDLNVKLPEYTTPQDLEIDNAINFIDKQAVESGRVALSDERKGILRDILKNPNATKEQKEQTILTMQGYDKDTKGEVSNKFYMQQDENGVYVPKLLKHGQRPPKGTAINSFHGTQADANDDAWYTDLSKSLANGLVSAAGGLVDLGQAGYQLATGEESEFLTDARNSVDFFKFKKDEDLNKSIYNTEGITKWADLLDKDRIDISPSALWGTFNGLAESLSEFGFGTMVGGSIIKGAKAAKYGLQGVEKAVELGSAAQKSAIVFGSTIAQLGDVMEAGKEAGLKGRDLPAFSLTTAIALGSIDAMTGLEGKVMSDLFKRSKKQILKNAIKTVERDAAGNITPEAFKELAKRTSIQYGEMARNAGKEIVKDAIGEGTQEAVQDFTQKAAENLWDKMTDDERGQFGTDITSPQAFGSYLNSFATGAWTGVPMALQQQAFKKRNEEQSIHVYDRVKQGEEGVKALRVDLNEALVNNDISQSEYEQANFKIDKYQQYHELTSKYNIDPKDEKRAFELSFQIEGMKTDIPTDENLISKMKPLERSDVEADQSQVKTLQKELNEIILRAKVKGEPTIGKKTEEAIAKEKEKEASENIEENNSKLNQEKKVKEKQPDIEGLGKEKVITYPKLENKPHWKDDKRTYSEIDTEEFNHPSTDARTIHRVVRKEAYNKPNHKLFGNLTKRLYSYINDEGNRMKGDVIEVTMEDGKKIRVASSKQEFKDDNDKIVRWDDIFRRHFRSERTQGNEEGLPVGIRAVDLNNPFNEDKGEDYKPGKIALKVFDARTGKFLSWAKETKTGSAESLDKAGNELYTAEQKELLKTLEQQAYNETPEGGDVIGRLTKPKPKPTPTEKAKVATDKIVEEAKVKVKEQKASVPLTITKQVRQQLYDLNFSKANVDNMKPERALDIINKQETNKKEDGKQEKSNVDGKKSIGGNNEEANGESESTSKELKLPKVKQNKSRSDRGIKDPFRKKASEIDPANAYESVITYFAGKGFVSMDSLRKFFKETKKYNIKEWVKTNTFKRQNLTQKGAPTIDEVANKLWENQSDRLKDLTTEDYKNAIEEVLRTHTSPIDMAKELLENNGIGVDLTRLEEITLGALKEAEKEGYSEEFDNITDALEGKTDEELKALAEKDKWEEGTDIIINDNPDDVFQKVKEEVLSEKEFYKKYKATHVDLRSKTEEDALNTFNKIKENGFNKAFSVNAFPLYKGVESGHFNFNAKKGKYFYLLPKEALIDGPNGYKIKEGWIPSDEDFVKQENDGDTFYQAYLNSKNKLQKESNKPSVYSQKVIDKLQKALPKVKIVFDANLKAAGKWSPSTNTITINPEYAGKDTAIHEAGHILIDAMGYENKIIQQAIKQLRGTDLYTETKQRYPELNEEQLDKEILAEAIGREGADIFDNVSERSKFKAYLDYIFDWLKQKLGLDKNIAKGLAKQIIGGIKTKDLKGVVTGKEQLQKNKKPFAAQALKYNQYAMEEGFDAQIEFEKYQKALVELKEAEEIEQDVLVNGTQEEYKEAEKEYKAAKKEFAIKAKKYLGFKKYQKDFRAVQALLEDKDLEDYTYEELNDLSVKLHSFNDRAAKSLKARVHLKIGHKATVKQNEIHKNNEGFIEALGKTSDISPLKRKIMHISHASEKNADLQALALASGKAIIDKLSEANSLKDTHAKLGLKVIREENKRLGITGTAMNRFSSDSSKYFEWMINEDGEYLTMDEAKSKGLSQAKLDYLDFHRETVAGYRESMSANDYENSKMAAIRVDKNFREAYKSEGLIPAFSYYLGGGATNLGKVRILHNGKVMSYSEIEKEIISSVDKKSIQSIAKALYDLLVANIKARYQLKKGQNIDEKDNPLELKGDAEYSLNEKGQLVSKFDKPRNKDRGYSKDFYKAMNQFIDESAHVKHISKIMPLVEAVEYLNKNGYAEEGYAIKPNVAKWIDDWKALHIFKEPHVNDPIIDAAVKSMRKLVASTTMWFNPVANTINVFIGNYNNWRAENAETLARGNARLFGGKGSRKEVGVVNDYALGIIKKYNLVNQDFDSHPVIKVGSIFSKLATFGTQVGEYQIQGSLGLGLLSQEEYDSFEFTEDKYGNKVLTVKKGVDEDKLKAKMTKVKNRVTDIHGKYPDEDRRNIMRGEFGKALFQFKVWMPDWFKERFSAKYINAYGQEKEGSYTKMLRVGVKEMYNDLKKGDIKKALNNPSFKTNLKGMITIGALLALKHSDDDDKEKKKGGLNWDNALSQVLFIFDLEQDKYMVSNPAAVLGKIKDLLNAFEALIGFEEDAWQKTKRVLPGNKAITFGENLIK
jgi:hypothetical protein